MSTKPTAAPKKPALQSKAELKAKQEAIEAQRKRTQNIILFVVAFAFLVVVIGVVVVASRPPEAEVNLAAINKKYEGVPMGVTGADYPIKFPTLGNATAPVKMEEISSFACPACRSYHDSVVAGLVDKAKSGHLYFVYLPTDRTGDFSAQGKELITKAGFCAMEQGKFWQMHDVLFDWQQRYGAGMPEKTRIQAGAEKLGIDGGKFSTCLDSAEAKKYVEDSNKFVVEQRKMASTPAVFMYVNGTQIKPPTQSGNTPDSLNGLSVSDIRGIIEANAPKS
jgi:protein-disulfide isomerase